MENNVPVAERHGVALERALSCLSLAFLKRVIWVWVGIGTGKCHGDIENIICGSTYPDSPPLKEYTSPKGASQTASGVGNDSDGDPGAPPCPLLT